MSTPYFVQPKNDIAAPLRDWDRLRASGNLSYLEFIALVTELWERRTPDVPIFPTQGKQFARYPCIVYGTQVKTAMQSEPKKRHREFITNPNTNQVYRITGQRFKLVVSFSVTTENEPKLAEEILEAFEDFMDEITPVLKKSGLSEIVYGRQLPDAMENRDAEDICKRSVAYEVTIERVRQIPVDQLNEIVVQARTFVESIRNVFTGTAGDDFIVVADDHAIPLEAEVLVTPDEIEFLPEGLHAGWRYVVDAIDGNKLYLTTIGGDPINITADGIGRLSLWLGKVKVDIEDEFATPNS